MTPIRVVVAGLGPSEQPLAVARALREGGIEVVYLGVGAGVGEVVRAAVQEDVDVVVVPGVDVATVAAALTDIPVVAVDDADAATEIVTAALS
jgi:methylmalonyl-CoA mutase cobalamin-binding subunit